MDLSGSCYSMALDWISSSPCRQLVWVCFAVLPTVPKLEQSPAPRLLLALVKKPRAGLPVPRGMSASVFHEVSAVSMGCKINH